MGKQEVLESTLKQIKKTYRDGAQRKIPQHWEGLTTWTRR